MQRAAANLIAHWLHKPNRKPLVIRGARQVGKSTLVRQFAAAEGLELHEINLERHLVLEEVFGSLDLTRVTRELSGLIGRDVLTPGSLLFLDEIQATPAAIACLRYFHEERPGAPVIAAGSLLEFALARHSFSMPVGRIEYLHLGPMTFEEFLTATSPDLLPFLQRATAAADAIPATAHARLLTCQREYLFVGGMPEAVLAFSGNRRLQDVIEVQRSIAATFKDDFARYASQSALIRLHRVFEAAPRAVGRKVKYSFFAKDETAREVRAAIDLLAKARVLARVSHSHCSGVPLAADVDESCYKLLFLDIGLMNRVCGLDWRTVSALDERGLVNEGPMAEQFVGQHLLYAEGGLEEPRLYYWLREAKSANAEVDYVLARGLRIVPVEVKAGQSGTLRSVLQFVQDKRAPVALRFDLNPPSVQRVRHRLRQAAGTAEVELDLISLPLYLVGQTPRVLDEHLAGLLPA